MIVAPSFVITMSPMPATNILSIPLGPIVDRTISATILAAIMLLLWASLPLDREVPSLRIKTGVSDISNQILSRADVLPKINICRRFLQKKEKDVSQNFRGSGEKASPELSGGKIIANSLPYTLKS